MQLGRSAAFLASTRCSLRERSTASPYSVALRILLEQRHDADLCRQEARWLADEVRARHRLASTSAWSAQAMHELMELARRAARNEPLSYVIGT